MKKIYLLLVVLLFAVNMGVAQTFKVGDKVNIEWKGKWFAGKILEVQGTNYKVSYDGYDASWNEVVTVARLQAYSNKETQVDQPATKDPAVSSSNGIESMYKGVETIWDIEVSNDDKFIVCANSYGSLMMLSAADLTLIKEIKIGKSPVMTVSLSAGAKYIAAGCADGKVFIYQKSGEKDWSEYNVVDSYASVTKIRFSPVAEELCIVAAPKEDYRDTKVDVYSVSEKKIKTTLLNGDGAEYVISGISFSADGSKIAFANSMKKAGVLVYDTQTGKQMYVLNAKKDVVSCSFSADGKLLVAGGADKSISAWNTETKAMLWKSSWNTGGENYLYGVALAPDGKSVAACGKGTGSRIKIFDIKTGALKTELGKNNSGGNAVCFSANSENVFVALTTFGDLSKVVTVYKSKITK